MDIVGEVKEVVDKNNAFSSKFYEDNQNLLLQYNELIEKGIITKRQPQSCSIYDKLRLDLERYRLNTQSK